MTSTNQDYVEWAGRIKDAMKEANLTQAQVAKDFGHNRSYLSQCLNNTKQSAPLLSRIEKKLSKLGVTV